MYWRGWLAHDLYGHLPEPSHIKVTQSGVKTGETATLVLGASSELAEQAAKLRAEVDKFLTTLRSA